jgi:thiol-disulfide isomerase/thioredoxin
MKHLVFLLTLLCSGLAFAEDKERPLEFPDLQGKSHTPLVAAGRKATVLIFVSPYCPTSNTFMPEVNRIAAEYGDRFAFYYVEADAAIPLPDAKKHAEVFEMKAPVLLDREQRLAKQTKAKFTPEAVVLGKDGATLYQGRVNDLYVTQTKKLKEPKTHDLRAALDDIAAGRPVAVPSTKAIGCAISGVE